MTRYRVTTVVHEQYVVDADTAEEACDLACNMDDPDNVFVADRTAEVEDDHG